MTLSTPLNVAVVLDAEGLPNVVLPVADDQWENGVLPVGLADTDAVDPALYHWDPDGVVVPAPDGETENATWT